MKRLFVIIFVLAILSSCAKRPKVPEVDYVPEKGTRYVTSSWYGPKFHGRPTSSGERYDMNGLTAAHKTMKFGTKLRVTNPDNNKSVVVVVNDRGPFVRGRDLDLSYGAAKAIGLTDKGVGRVKIEHLGRNRRYVKRIPFVPSKGPGMLTVQVGSFTETSNAYRLKNGLEFKYSNVYVTSADVNGKKFYRVRIGKFDSYDSAYSMAEKLAEEGYRALIMKRD